MFVGHLAVALAAKAAAPRHSLGTLIAAAFGLDLLWPLLLFARVERVQVQPGVTAFTPLRFDSYPWSHSLLLAAMWGTALALAFRRSRAAAWILGTLVVSHWILDFVTHRPDLPLWPGGPLVGLGLWNSVPWTLVVEGALLAAGLAIYVRATSARGAAGVWALWSLVALCLVIWASGPFSPPPPSATAIAIVALAMWLFPLWGAWIDGQRDNATKVTALPGCLAPRGGSRRWLWSLIAPIRVFVTSSAAMTEEMLTALDDFRNWLSPGLAHPRKVMKIGRCRPSSR